MSSSVSYHVLSVSCSGIVIQCHHYVGSAGLCSQLGDIAEEDLEKMVVVQPTKGIEPEFIKLVQRLGQVRVGYI